MKFFSEEANTFIKNEDELYAKLDWYQNGDSLFPAYDSLFSFVGDALNINGHILSSAIEHDMGRERSELMRLIHMNTDMAGGLQRRTLVIGLYP